MMAPDRPATSRERKATVIGLLACLVVGGVVFGGLVPGLRPSFAPPTFLTVHGIAYYWAEVFVPTATIGTGVSATKNVTVHNASFSIYTVNWSVLGRGFLRGNATVPGLGGYTFSVGGPSVLGNRTDENFSADQEIGVLWSGGLVAYLLEKS